MTAANIDASTRGTTTGDETRAVTLTRILDAPREMVFKAWTDSKQLARWWGPTWFTNPVCEIDARPGGALYIEMVAPDGTVYPMKGTVTEIVEPERLVLHVSALEDEHGVAHLEDITTVTFEEHEGKTRLTVHAAVTHATADAEGALAGMEEGWNQSLNSLSELVQGTPTAPGEAGRKKPEGYSLTVEPGKHNTVMTYVLDAPRDLVFKVMCDPEGIPQWWGPRMYTTTVDVMEAKPGGRWRYVQRDAQGEEAAFNGVYHMVTPERIINTFEWEGMPGHVLLATVTLEDLGGKTKVTENSVFQTIEDRDGMVASGMEWGALELIERLGEVLAKAQNR
jgi:uncharacterized protein YndB with AHSA1/START domain